MIHMVFIPPLIMTLMFLALYIPVIQMTVDVSKSSPEFKFSAFEPVESSESVYVVYLCYIYWAGYSTILCTVDPLIGFINYVVGMAMYMFVIELKRADMDPSSPLFGKMLYACLGMKVLGWGSQFIGHGVYEQRAPAILTNLLFINLAPFFEIYKVLYMFGYRKEEVDSWQPIVMADIAHYR